MGGSPAAPRSEAGRLKMDRVLVDTTVVIDILRGRPAPYERVRDLDLAGATAYLSAVSIEEVARGVRPEEIEATKVLLAAFEVVPLGPDAAWTAGIWRRDLAARGVTIPQGDCLIAATAHAAGARLATGNPKHFPFDDLVVEHWPAGE